MPEQSSLRSTLPCVGKQLAHERGWGVCQIDLHRSQAFAPPELAAGVGVAWTVLSMPPSSSITFMWPSSQGVARPL